MNVYMLHSLLMSVNKTYNLVEYKPHERRTITWENVSLSNYNSILLTP